MQEFGLEKNLNNADSESESDIDTQNETITAEINNEDVSELITEYVLDIETYILDNSIEIDWTNENFEKLFMLWGFEDLDRNNVGSVYNTIANAFVWNINQQSGLTFENFFDIFINVDDFISLVNKRMAAFGFDPDNLLQVDAFLNGSESTSENNRKKLLDFGSVYHYMFQFFKDIEFQDKLAFLVNQYGSSVGNEDTTIIKWYNDNLANGGAEEWIQQAKPINAFLELLEFFNNAILTELENSGVEWSAAFAMNFIHCIRLDLKKTQFNSAFHL